MTKWQSCAAAVRWARYFISLVQSVSDQVFDHHMHTAVRSSLDVLLCRPCSVFS
jgi:hypothetical protein